MKPASEFNWSHNAMRLRAWFDQLPCSQGYEFVLIACASFRFVHNLPPIKSRPIQNHLTNWQVLWEGRAPELIISDFGAVLQAVAREQTHGEYLNHADQHTLGADGMQFDRPLRSCHPPQYCRPELD